MSHNQLTKQEAFELISSVIDGEVDQETQKAFFRYIKHDSYIRKQYRSAKQVKELLAKRCPAAKAPDHLKYRIREALAAEQSTPRKPPSEDLVYDIPCKRTPCSYSPENLVDIPFSEAQSYQQSWMYLGATVFLATILLWGVAMVTEPFSSSPTAEEFASRYYAENNGGFIPPTIAASSSIGLETIPDFPFAIPSLKGARLQGVVYTDISPAFKTPLLEYFIAESNQYVYVFAFDMEMLENNQWLSRHEEVINECTSVGSYHLQHIDGRPIVSWKENETWYTAISEQDGKSLISLLQN